MIALNCKELSESIVEDIRKEVEELNITSCLAVIQVGTNPASTTYVRKKKEACEKVGFKHIQINLDESVTEEELLNRVKELNEDNSVDGILVQLPLPKHINTDNVINSISPEKDVDGFSPINVGNLILGRDCFIPCTPAGILEVLKHFEITTRGKNTVVFGRSNIVGRPIANILSQKPWDANVTIVHSKTSEEEKIRAVTNADIIILAVGAPYTLDYATYSGCIKTEAVVIDVGINRIPDSSKKSGTRMVGDFESWGFQEMEDLGNNDSYKNLRYTPVPGGIGLLTVACLMKNTLKAFNNRRGT